MYAYTQPGMIVISEQLYNFILKRKFEQWWSAIPPISAKQTITSQLNCLLVLHFYSVKSIWGTSLGGIYKY